MQPKSRLDRTSPSGGPPYVNLLPVVDLLVGAGNRALDGGFVMNPDGWRCRLAARIDFDLVESNFEIPETISLGRENDIVLDRLSWCSIDGPDAT